LIIWHFALIENTVQYLYITVFKKYYFFHKKRRSGLGLTISSCGTNNEEIELEQFFKWKMLYTMLSRSCTEPHHFAGDSDGYPIVIWTLHLADFSGCLKTKQKKVNIRQQYLPTNKEAVKVQMFFFRAKTSLTYAT
jgi:hypothetical protein